jgi:hypothetical protein
MLRVRDTKASWERLLRFYLTPRRPPRRGPESEAEPVEPYSPKPLSGGAAATLEFDE